MLVALQQKIHFFTMSNAWFASGTSAVQRYASAQEYFESVLGKPTRVGNSSFTARPLLLVQRDQYTASDRALAATLGTTWTPKHLDNAQQRTVPAFPQRCPAVWSDNICLLWDPATMSVPLLLCGEWRKRVSQYGGPVELVHGLALGGGGHRERMGRRDAAGYEKGAMDTREAADRELIEELKVPAQLVSVTLPVALFDSALNDPRMDGLRVCYARWLRVNPQASEELRSIHGIPIDALFRFAQDNVPVQVTNAAGVPLHFVLNHDVFIKALILLEPLRKFIECMRVYADMERSGSAASAVAAPTSVTEGVRAFC